MTFLYRRTFKICTLASAYAKRAKDRRGDGFFLVFTLLNFTNSWFLMCTPLAQYLLLIKPAESLTSVNPFAAPEVLELRKPALNHQSQSFKHQSLVYMFHLNPGFTPSKYNLTVDWPMLRIVKKSRFCLYNEGQSGFSSFQMNSVRYASSNTWTHYSIFFKTTTVLHEKWKNE